MSFVLTLKLKTEIFQEHKINKSFNVAIRMYNSLLSHEMLMSIKILPISVI